MESELCQLSGLSAARYEHLKIERDHNFANFASLLSLAWYLSLISLRSILPLGVRGICGKRIVSMSPSLAGSCRHLRAHSSGKHS
jgi:hypothetical protein